VIDWAPRDSEGDKILFIFDCGQLGADEAHIKLGDPEIDRWEWAPADSLSDYLIPRLLRRLTWAREALGGGTTSYLEHGELSSSWGDAKQVPSATTERQSRLA
jgi:hypothetical protein